MPTMIHRVCPQCGRKNQVAAARAADRAVCGACKAALGPSADPIDADPAIFDAVVGGCTVPVLVDFWATWCRPCIAAAPEVAKAARTAAGRAVVLKVDTDRHPALAARFAIHSVPTFAVFKDGRAAAMHPGAVSSHKLLTLLGVA